MTLPPLLALPYRVLYQAQRRWQMDRCTQAASSLAFQTALALAPGLAVAFALLKAFGQFEAQSALLNAVAELLLPSSPEAREEIVSRLASFSSNIAAGAMGTLGGLATIVVSFLLFLNVEAFWNAVWCSPKKRPFVSKFLLFYASATLLPLLVAVSLGPMMAYLKVLAGFSLIAGWGATLAIFTVGNRVMPVVRVEWRSALIGGAVSAVLFEVAKFGFSLYLARVIGSYRSIYGALGLLPIFFVWIYLAWLILLLGIEVAHAVQRLPALEAASSEIGQEQGNFDGQRFVVVSGELALHLMADVAAHFAEGKKALPEDMVEARYGLSEKAVRMIFQHLSAKDLILVVEGGYLLSRPAERISLAEIVSVFAMQAASTQGVPYGNAKVGKFLAELTSGTEDRLAKLTLADLV